MLLTQVALLKEMETRNTDLGQQLEQLRAQLTSSAPGADAGEEARDELGVSQTAGPSNDAGAASGNNTGSGSGSQKASRSRAARQRQPLGSGLEREAGVGGGSNLMRHALVWSGGAAGAVVAAAVVAVAHGRSRS